MPPEAKIFAGRHTMDLAKKIAGRYGIPMGNVKITEFSDGEFCHLLKTIRGKCLLIHSTNRQQTI